MLDNMQTTLSPIHFKTRLQEDNDYKDSKQEDLLSGTENCSWYAFKDVAIGAFQASLSTINMKSV